MKKPFHLVCFLLACAIVISISSGRVYARLSGTEPGSDPWCMGVAGKEVCLDATGNLIPTTTNIGDLGTTALRFKDLFLQGNATVAGTLTVTGATTLSGQIVPLVRTKAQVDVLVPAAAGATIICSDCTITYSLCTATGTAAAQWARAGSATVGCGSGN